MLQSAHIFLMSLYFALPPVVLIALFAVAHRRGIPAAQVWPKVTVAIATSLLLGIAASMVQTSAVSFLRSTGLTGIWTTSVSDGCALTPSSMTSSLMTPAVGWRMEMGPVMDCFTK